MKKLLPLTLLLLLATAAYAYQFQVVGQGRLLQATAFPNGAALTVVQTSTGLTLGYHDAQGYTLAEAPLLLAGQPETVIITACGQYAQVFVGYAPSLPDDLNTAFVERFVWEMPQAQACAAQDYLPIVIHE